MYQRIFHPIIMVYQRVFHFTAVIYQHTFHATKMIYQRVLHPTVYIPAYISGTLTQSTALYHNLFFFFFSGVYAIETDTDRPIS